MAKCFSLLVFDDFSEQRPLGVGKTQEAGADGGQLLPSFAVVLVLAKVGHDRLQSFGLFDRDRSVPASFE